MGTVVLADVLVPDRGVGGDPVAEQGDALGILDRSLDNDARAACDELVHPGNAVSDFHNTTGWIKASI